MNMNLIPDQPVNCPSCGKKFEGPFCYACGEKQTSPKDYTLKKYSAQAIDMFTHFDGKFFRTIKYLLFFPGKLTQENLAGRKVSLMKPVQLFVLISLVYFFLMKDVDVFVNFLGGMHEEAPILLEAQKVAASKNILFEEYAAHYDQVLAKTSKTFIFIVVPMIAVGVWLLFFRKSKQIVPHLIFTTHFFTFFLAFTLIYFEVFLNSWLDPALLSRGQKLIGIWIEIITVIIYIFFALKRVYGQGWLITSLKTLALSIWMLTMLGLYNRWMGWLNFLLV
jgi:hypothetical protein